MSPPADAGGSRLVESSIWVGGLPRGTGTDDLTSAFAALGVEAMSDVYIPPGKDFGFVRFLSWDEAEHAMQLVEGRGLTLQGHPLEVKLSNTEKRASGSQGVLAGKSGSGKSPSKGCSGCGNWGPDPCGKGPSNPWGKGAPEHWGKGTYAQDAWGKGAWHDDWGKGGWPPADTYYYYYSKGAPSGVPGVPWGGNGFDQLQPPGKGSRAGKDSEISIMVGGLAEGTTVDELREAFVNEGVGGLTDAYIPTGRNFGFIRFAHMGEAQNAMLLQGLVVCGKSVSLEMAEGDKRSAQVQARAPQHVAVSSGDVYAAGKGGYKDSWPDGKGFGKAGYSSWVKGGCSGEGNIGLSVGSRGEVSVKIGNLPDGATSDDVREAFAAHGVDSMTDCYIPPGKKFGFLRFASIAEGEFALTRAVVLRGFRLSLEPSVSAKRNSNEMASMEPVPRPLKALRG